MKNKKNITIIGCVLVFAFVAGLGVKSYTSYDFVTLEGQKQSFSHLNEKTLIINYFAEWCAPCLREIPELNAFNAQKSDEVVLFAVSFDALSEQELAALKKKYGIEFPLITYFKSELPFEKPQYLPATFVIKPGGELAGQLLGEQTVESLNEAISEF